MEAEGRGGTHRKEALVRRFGTLKPLGPPDRVIRLVSKKRLRLITDMLDLDRQHRLLHLGCQDGETLSRLDADLKVGIDHSPTSLETARKRLGTGAELIDVAFDSLPFPEAHFDRILVSQDLEQIEKPTAVIAEVRRVLAHNGLVVVAVSREGLLDEVRGALDRLRILGLLGAGRLCRYLLPRRIRETWAKKGFSEQKLGQMVQGTFRVRRVAGVPCLPCHLVLVAQLVTA